MKWFLSLLFVSGCSVINTGPQMAEQIGGIAAGAAKSLMTAYQPDQMSVDVDGKISDPRYNVKMFFGAGTYVDMVVSLIGADLGFGIDSAGHGIDVPLETKERLLEIIKDPNLDEEARRNAITEAILEWLKQ